MARTADSSRLRARAVRLPWADVAAEHRKLVRAAEREDQGRVERSGSLWDDHLLRRRAMDIHLMWGCAATLGAPRMPFTVWVRDPKDRPQRVEATVKGGTPTSVEWGNVEAGCVQVTCRPFDPAKPVSVSAMRRGKGTDGVVAAAAVQPSGPGPVTLTVRCSGATWATVVNGHSIAVAIEPLDQIVNDQAWTPVELVGLPVDAGSAGFDYDAVDQGPVASPLPPVEAALHRLRRGGPPIGWAPVTEDGRAAPPWQAPDPERLVEEVRRELLPELPPMYALSVPEFEQHAVTGVRPVDPPQQGGRTSSLSAKADPRPWPALMLPALSDPFLNLACGFGATYTLEPLDDEREQVAVGHSDFLVTARYDRFQLPATSGGEMAAYAPAPDEHRRVPDPVPLVAKLDGRVAPVAPDQPWRESVRLRWNRVEPEAGASPVTEAALATYELGSTDKAVSLLPPRDAGGDRPLLVGPDGPESEEGHDRAAVVDGGREVPIGSGGRAVGYAVAVSDVHGIWSGWQDVPWHGDEPAPHPPRVVSLALDTHYVDSAACPATLQLEIALEWLERRTKDVELVALFFPMPTPTSTPPPGASPTGPVPAGCFTRAMGLSFSGDVPTATGCTVTPLSEDGTQPVAAGPAQGADGRRYALTAPVPTLSFAATPRWGVQVWVRRTLRVGPSPSDWAPPPASPALASAASPVPVVPLPGPWPLTGVPLGSTPDPQGCSHATVEWSLPSSAGIRTCIVWEVSETALRQRTPGDVARDESLTPGQRLDELVARYDAMAPAHRRAAFRRLQELPGDARATDVTLPKGSTDIHLFAVTTMTTSGIESPWPDGPTPHEHLRPVIAPRLVAPSPPVARAGIGSGGTVTVELSVASAVPVDRFRLHGTTSVDAARELGSMGPSLAEAEVDETAVPTKVDPVSGLPVWTATWTGTLPGRWLPWLLRAVAVPVDTDLPRGVRGVLSAPSDVVSVLVPPTTAPVLEPLVAEVWGSDSRGVVVRSATTGLPRAVPLGSHRFDAVAGEQALASVAFEHVARTPLTTPPAAAATEVVLEQGERASGVSPLALWFTRPVAADPVTVRLSLADPLGRVTTRTIEVPGWSPPAQGLHVAIVGLRVVKGRVVFGIDTDAPTSAREGYVLEVVARQRLKPFGPPRPPFVPPRPPFSGRPPFPPKPPLPQSRRPRQLSRSIALADVPALISGPAKPTRIEVWRPARKRPGAPPYFVVVPMGAPLTVSVAVVAPDGARVEATGSL